MTSAQLPVEFHRLLRDHVPRYETRKVAIVSDESVGFQGCEDRQDIE